MSEPNLEKLADAFDASWSAGIRPSLSIRGLKAAMFSWNSWFLTLFSGLGLQDSMYAESTRLRSGLAMFLLQTPSASSKRPCRV